MSDNILSAVLTFGLMAAGTAAIGTEMFSGRHPAAAPASSQTLAPVIVTGHRVSAVADAVMLAPVMVIGHRKAWAEVAVDSHEAAPKVE